MSSAESMGPKPPEDDSGYTDRESTFADLGYGRWVKRHDAKPAGQTPVTADSSIKPVGMAREGAGRKRNLVSETRPRPPLVTDLDLTPVVDQPRTEEERAALKAKMAAAKAALGHPINNEPEQPEVVDQDIHASTAGEEVNS